ncbi:MAG: LysR family transcriptional regulator [Proteobacteria bacterium]|nr:LysR family transcriptional regulator [Pseudomonadota bacterium]
MNLSLRQLRAFAAVAHEQSFVRAASSLHVSPSAITLAIRELERDVGVRLFDRTTRNVSMTRAASVFLPIVERTLNDLERVVGDLQLIGTSQTGSVVVAGAASLIDNLIAPAIGRLAQEHPGISVSLSEDITESVIESVLEGRIDFGVTSVWRSYDGIEAVPILEDRMGVLAAPSHPLAQTDAAIDWSQIAKLPLAALAPGAGVRAVLINHPKVGQILQRPLYQASSMNVLRALVGQNVSVAIDTWLSARPFVDRELRFRPLRDPSIWRKVCLVRRESRSLSPAAAQLVTCLKSELQSLRQDKFVRLERASNDRLLSW